MIVKHFLIKNRLGLHARASVKLTQLTSRYQSEVWLSGNGKEVNGKSIMGVMLLAASQGSILEVRVAGSDENIAMNAIQRLIDELFGESE